MLEDKDILQVDATIITGILILLTLSNVAGSTNAARFLASNIAYAIIPFALSAIILLLTLGFVFGATANKLAISSTLTIIGLVFLVFILILFFFISYNYPDLFNLNKLQPRHISSQNVTHPAKPTK